MSGWNLSKPKFKMKNKSVKKELQEYILKTLENRNDFTTSKDLAEMFNSVTGYKVQSPAIRMAVHELRSKEIAPIIAKRNGYKIATSKREIQEQSKKLEEMIFEIMDALTGMTRMAENLKFNFGGGNKRKSKFTFYSPIFEQILDEIENGGKILEVLKKYNVSYQKISREDKIKIREIRYKKTIPIKFKKERKSDSELSTNKRKGRLQKKINFSDVSDKFFEELKKGRTRKELLLEYNIGYQTISQEDKIKIRQIKYPNLVPLQLRRNAEKS